MMWAYVECFPFFVPSMAPSSVRTVAPGFWAWRKPCMALNVKTATSAEPCPLAQLSYAAEMLAELRNAENDMGNLWI